MSPEVMYSRCASELGIDLRRDRKSYPNVLPQFAQIGENGATERHIKEAGADYTFIQIDYFDGPKVRASRMVALIFPRNRTEIAYWTKRAPETTLDVHRGKGVVIIGDPERDETKSIPIDSTRANKVTLPSGCFYTIRADTVGTEPLIISGLYDACFNWDVAEIALTPDQHIIETPEGKIEVPHSFTSALQ